MEDSEQCPNCKTTKYNKPSMKLMINVCGHVLCETCVEQLFFRGSGQCPFLKCNRILKKNEFREQVYEDTYIEKEIVIRKKITKDLNRNENEFPNLREFNDYLETVETLIFNLTNNIDEEETIKKVEELKKEAKETSKNRSRLIMEAKRDNPLYKYKPISFYSHGPALPNVPDISKSYAPKLGINASQLTSGFPTHVPVQRLLQDAFSDLFYSVRNYPS